VGKGRETPERMREAGEGWGRWVQEFERNMKKKDKSQLLPHQENCPNFHVSCSLPETPLYAHVLTLPCPRKRIPKMPLLRTCPHHTPSCSAHVRSLRLGGAESGSVRVPIQNRG